MRIIILVLLGTLCLQVGCNNELSPPQVVGAFIKAIGSGHPDKTASLINHESRAMVTTNLVAGQGIAWIAAQSSRSKLGYKLVLEKSTARQAVVVLKGSYLSTDLFSKSRFPAQLRKQGVRFYLVKESNRWRIDLLKTENKLSDIGLKYLCTLYKGVLPDVFPPWMPVPPGMGYPTPGEQPSDK